MRLVLVATTPLGNEEFPPGRNPSPLNKLDSEAALTLTPTLTLTLTLTVNGLIQRLTSSLTLIQPWP